MKYKELLQHDLPIFLETSLIGFNINRYDYIPSYYFTHFRRDTLTSAESQSLHSAWKARISINPDDLEKAWDLIYPVLLKSADSFKVVDMSRLATAKARHEERQAQLAQANPRYLKDNTTLLRQVGFKFFELLNRKKPHTFFDMARHYLKVVANYLTLYAAPQSYVTSYVASQYNSLRYKYKIKDKHLQRFSDGMSLTVYILPGTEDKAFKMLSAIEHLLSENHIRPGVIYPTDRVLGEYVSIRHPGAKTYHDAVIVNSYNPDNILDPFPKIEPHTPLIKDEDGRFPVYKERCGVLPCYVDDEGQVFWGYIETNRVGPTIAALPAGARDVIIIKDGTRQRLELGKPFPDGIDDSLSDFVGRMFRNEDYQAILSRLDALGYHLYAENPLEAALHETEEEHGTDLRKQIGRDNEALIRFIPCKPQEIISKNGSEVMRVWVAHLKSPGQVNLRRTEKVDRKIKRNYGRAFYEQGKWGTLNTLQQNLDNQKAQYLADTALSAQDETRRHLITGAISACEGAMQFLRNTQVSVNKALGLGFYGMRFGDLFKNHGVFTDDLRKSADTENPTVRADIDLVYILSGRTTALGQDADGLNRPFDLSDDIERIKEGVRLAIRINALKANKRPEDLSPEDYVTPIYYNGRAIHNRDLRQALKEGLIDYPAELFIIEDISPENTIGQVQSFKRHVAAHHYKNIAVVSSAYHLARVARTIGKDSPQVTNGQDAEHPLSELNIFLYGVHKTDKRRGIFEDLLGEYNAMMRYSSGETPSIPRYSSVNTFFTDMDFGIVSSLRRAMFFGCRGGEDIEPDADQSMVLTTVNSTL